MGNVAGEKSECRQSQWLQLSNNVLELSFGSTQECGSLVFYKAESENRPHIHMNLLLQRDSLETYHQLQDVSKCIVEGKRIWISFHQLDEELE